MEGTPAESLQKVLIDYFDVCSKIIALESDVEESDVAIVSMIRETRLEALRELGLSEDSRHPEFYALWGQKRSSLQSYFEIKKAMKKELGSLIKEQERIALEFSKTLPTINEAKLRPNHLYRGALARNILLRPEIVLSSEGGFYIEDMAFQLNGRAFGSTVDFTGIYNQELALTFAMCGSFLDNRSREDAVVIEVPCDLASQRVSICGGLEKYFFPSDLFKDVRLKIYRPTL